MTILYIFLALCVFILFYSVYKSDQRKRKLRGLKSGDPVQVRIYSQVCECSMRAKYQGRAGKYIVAELDQEGKEITEACSKFQGQDCWNHVTQFSERDVIVDN